MHSKGSIGLLWPLDLYTVVVVHISGLAVRGTTCTCSTFMRQRPHAAAHQFIISHEKKALALLFRHRPAFVKSSRQVNAAKNGGPRKRGGTLCHAKTGTKRQGTYPQAGRRKINGDHGGRTIKQAPGSGFTQLCNVQTSDSELQS